MENIKLIPTEDLFEELSRRYPEGFVAAYCATDHEQKFDDVDHTIYFGEGTHGAINSLCLYLLWHAQSEYYERNIKGSGEQQED